MKKVLLCVLAVVILVSGFGCVLDRPGDVSNPSAEISNTSEDVSNTSDEVSNTSEDESKPHEIPDVLFGDSYGYGTFRYNLGRVREVEYDDYTKVDPDRIGETKTLELFGVNMTLIYDMDRRTEFATVNRTFYRSSDGNTFVFNAKTGKLINFLFFTFPEGMELRNERITPEQAKELCLNYARENYPEADLSEYAFTKEICPGEYNDSYSFLLQGFDKGIRVANFLFDLDMYGNMTLFMYSDERNPMIPELTDEDYAAGAKKRLQEHFADKSDIVEFKDFIVSQKITRYFSKLDKYAIDFTVEFSILFDDGKVENAMHQFYYLYDVPENS